MKSIKKLFAICYMPYAAHRGYIALVTVLIIGAVGIAIAISAILSGIGSSRTNLTVEENREALALADACAEHALIELKVSFDYSGDETLNFDKGNCEILAIEGSGNENRVIKTTGSVGNVIRKNQLAIQEINPDLIITSWQEVKSF